MAQSAEEAFLLCVHSEEAFLLCVHSYSFTQPLASPVVKGDTHRTTSLNLRYGGTLTANDSTGCSCLTFAVKSLVWARTSCCNVTKRQCEGHACKSPKCTHFRCMASALMPMSGSIILTVVFDSCSSLTPSWAPPRRLCPPKHGAPSTSGIIAATSCAQQGPSHVRPLR
jgi:hypothetical protein